MLVAKFSDFFAIPLTDIYSNITRNKISLECWKKEFVTVIPKTSTTENLGDLRNIHAPCSPAKFMRLDGSRLRSV